MRVSLNRATFAGLSARIPSRLQIARITPAAPPKSREQRAFRQKLARQTPAARTERSANGQFLAAGQGPRQLQVRHIRTGDQEHTAHRAQKRFKLWRY